MGQAIQGVLNGLGVFWSVQNPVWTRHSVREFLSRKWCCRPKPLFQVGVGFYHHRAIRVSDFWVLLEREGRETACRKVFFLQVVHVSAGDDFLASGQYFWRRQYL